MAGGLETDRGMSSNTDAPAGVPQADSRLPIGNVTAEGASHPGRPARSDRLAGKVARNAHGRGPVPRSGPSLAKDTDEALNTERTFPDNGELGVFGEANGSDSLGGLVQTARNEPGLSADNDGHGEPPEHAPVPREPAVPEFPGRRGDDPIEVGGREQLDTPTSRGGGGNAPSVENRTGSQEPERGRHTLAVYASVPEEAHENLAQLETRIRSTALEHETTPSPEMPRTLLVEDETGTTPLQRLTDAIVRDDIESAALRAEVIDFTPNEGGRQFPELREDPVEWVINTIEGETPDQTEELRARLREVADYYLHAADQPTMGEEIPEPQALTNESLMQTDARLGNASYLDAIRWAADVLNETMEANPPLDSSHAENGGDEIPLNQDPEVQISGLPIENDSPAEAPKQSGQDSEDNGPEAEQSTSAAVLPYEMRRISELFREIQEHHGFSTADFFTSFRAISRKGIPLTSEGFAAFAQGRGYLDTRALEEIPNRLESDWMAPTDRFSADEDANLREMRKLTEELRWAETVQHIIDLSPGDMRKAFGRVLTVLRLAEEPEPLPIREFIERKQFEDYTYSAYSRLEAGKRIPHIDHLRMIIDKSVIKDLDPNSTVMQLLFLYASNAEVKSGNPPNLPMSREELKTCSLWDLTDYFAQVSGLTHGQFAEQINFARSTIVRHKSGRVPDSSDVVDQVKQWLGSERGAMKKIIDQKAEVLASQNPDDVPEISETILDEALDEGFVFALQTDALHANLPTGNTGRVGTQLQEAMAVRGIDEERLVRRAGVHPDTVKDVLRGHQNNPQQLIRFRLFRALGYNHYDPEMLDFLFAES